MYINKYSRNLLEQNGQFYGLCWLHLLQCSSLHYSSNTTINGRWTWWEGESEREKQITEREIKMCACMCVRVCMCTCVGACACAVVCIVCVCVWKGQNVLRTLLTRWILDFHLSQILHRKLHRQYSTLKDISVQFNNHSKCDMQSRVESLLSLVPRLSLLYKCM